MLTYRELLKEGQVSLLHVNGFHSLKEHKLSGGINPPIPCDPPSELNG